MRNHRLYADGPLPLVGLLSTLDKYGKDMSQIKMSNSRSRCLSSLISLKTETDPHSFILLSEVFGSPDQNIQLNVFKYPSIAWFTKQVGFTKK